MCILTKGHLLWILVQQLDKTLSLTPSTGVLTAIYNTVTPVTYLITDINYLLALYKQFINVPLL